MSLARAPAEASSIGINVPVKQGTIQKYGELTELGYVH